MGWEMLQSTLYEDQDYFWGYKRGWRDHSLGVSAHPLGFWQEQVLSLGDLDNLSLSCLLIDGRSRMYEIPLSQLSFSTYVNGRRRVRQTYCLRSFAKCSGHIRKRIYHGFSRRLYLSKIKRLSLVFHFNLCVARDPRRKITN
jgi:hypothetical protein